MAMRFFDGPNLSYDYDDLIDDLESALVDGSVQPDTLIVVTREEREPYSPIVDWRQATDATDGETRTVREVLDEMRRLNSIL